MLTVEEAAEYSARSDSPNGPPGVVGRRDFAGHFRLQQEVEKSRPRAGNGEREIAPNSILIFQNKLQLHENRWISFLNISQK